MLGMVRQLSVWPENGAPFLPHWKPNGPVPWATVLKVTVSPGQLVCETRASAVVGTLTVRLAKLVTLLQAPTTRKIGGAACREGVLEWVKEGAVRTERGAAAWGHCKP